MNATRMLAVLLVVTAAMVSIATAATPPSLVNYQGVLRDPNGVPITGTLDMVFSFLDDPNAGNEILVDSHAGGGLAVVVDGGLFNVALGGGAVSDGTGAGTYLDLASVFADFGQVWMEIEVAGEPLVPRVQVLSAAYALNASYLGGKFAGQFIDTSSTAQVKTGNLTVDDLWVGGSDLHFGSGAQIFDPGTGLTIDGGCQATDDLILAAGCYNARIDITGDNTMAFKSGNGAYVFSSSLLASTMSLDDNGNLTLYGDLSVSTAATGAALVFGPAGAEGSITTSATALRLQAGDVSTDDLILNSGTSVNHGGITINGTGSMDLRSGTGDFQFFNGGGVTSIMRLQNSTPGLWLGIPGLGKIVLDPSGIGASITGQSVGLTLSAGADDGDDIQLQAGNDVTDGSITIQGNSNMGLEAGDGQFNFINGATSTITATLDGPGNLQIDGALTASGSDLDTETILSSGDRGILARGTYGASDTGEGGKFCDSLYTGEAELADGDTGVVGYGSYAGGIFRRRAFANSNCTGASFVNEVRLATASSAIESAAPKNFVQNHPYDPTKLVVYTSLEGDEVGTYTRGVARLQGGVARVPLGETFAWVTNPGLGLTAHVTPHGEWSDLYVESVTTSELVVRSRDGAGNGVFDYLVHGLRVGFERASVVRERDTDAYIPSTAPHEELYARHPELRPLSAGERFKAMHEAAGQRIDVERGRELVAAIGMYDPGVHGAPRNELLGGSSRTPAAAASKLAAPAHVVNEVAVVSSRPVDVPQGRLDPCRGIDGCALFVVAEVIEPGELLALDPQRSAELVLAAEPADPGVVGVAMDRAVEIEGRLHVPVISHAFAEVKADAGYGAIRAGDLLTSSPTPGHAMRSGDPRPGTVLGKAIEPLEAGTGLIRVLLMMR